MKPFAVVAILVVQALAVQASLLSRQKPGNDLEALCKDKDVNLSTYAELKQLAAKVGDHPKCNRETGQTITGLVEVIEHNKDDLCSMSSMKNYAQFHNSSLLAAFWRPEAGKNPKSLVRFATAYGLQVSNLCKRNMLDALTGQEGQRKLAAMDAKVKELFDLLTSDAGPAGKVLGEIGNRDEPLMPGDLGAFFEQHGCRESTLENTKILMWDVGFNFIRHVKSVCEQSFRPIYAPYMLPLVELANLGLSYQDRELESKLEDPATAKAIGRWSRLTFACESLGAIKYEEVNDEIFPRKSAKRVHFRTQEVEQPAQESLASVKVALDLERPIFDKSDEKLVAALAATKIDLRQQELLSAKVCKMSSAVKVYNLSRENLANLVFDLKAKGRVQNRERELQRVGSTERLLKALDFFAKYPEEAAYY